MFCSQLFPFRKQNHKSYYPIINDNFQLITSLLAHASTKFKRQYICNIFQSNVIMFQKPTICLISAKLIHICETRSSQLPCFFFCILSAAEKITSSVNKDFGKCSSQSFSLRRKLSEFCTRQIQSFSNSKYLAIAISIYFIKVAKLTSSLSALYMLRNVLIVVVF